MLLASLVIATLNAAIHGQALLNDPVVMEYRSIGPEAPISGGTVRTVEVDGLSGTLFVPDGAVWPGANLWIHFHTAAWFVVQEHQRARFSMPLLVLNWGQGSSTYAKPMAMPGSLGRWLNACLEVGQGVKKADCEWTLDNIQLHVSSFSAGYGAVREVQMRDPGAFKNLKTLILCDSMYGSLDSAQPGRTVLADHVAPWKALAQRAMDGKLTFITTTSQITPGSYAGTWEVAAATVKAAGYSMEAVAEGSIPAAKGEQRLLSRFDRGGWHVWSYAGEKPESHMTHPRRLAELIQFAFAPRP